MSGDLVPSEPRLSGRDLRLALVVGLVAALPFVRCLGHEFLAWDDGIIILGQPFLRTLSAASLWTTLSPIPAREEWLPLRDLTLMLNFALSAKAWGFALVNVLLQGLAAALSYGLFLALTRRRSAALIGALLFAVHATHVESVAWLSGRKDPLSTLFLILTLWGWVRFRRQGGSLAWPLLAFVAAMLSKANAFVAPAWLLAFDVLCWAPWRERSWRERLAPLVPFGVLGVAHVLIYVRSTSVDGVLEPYPPGGLATVLRTDAVLLCDYLRMLLFPLEHQAIYPVTFRTSLDLAVVGAFALLAGLLALGWRCRRERPLLGLGLVIAASSFLPYMNLIPHGIYFAERYLYLPSLAAALVVGDLLASRPWGALGARTRQAIGLGLALWVGLHAGVSSKRAAIWSDDETFWRYQAAQVPGNPAPLMNLAESHELRGELSEAAAVYRQLSSGERVVHEAVFRLARVERRRGDPRAAARLYERYLSRVDDPRGLNNLAECYLKLEQPEAAIRVYQAAVTKHPTYLLARRNLALALDARGREEEALVHWRALIASARHEKHRPLVLQARARLRQAGGQ